MEQPFLVIVRAPTPGPYGTLTCAARVVQSVSDDALDGDGWREIVAPASGARAWDMVLQAGSVEPRADIVVVEAGVTVPAGWLRRLAEAAASSTRIASVSAIAIRGDRGGDIQLVDQRVRAGSTRARPAMPFADGPCILLARQAINRVGPVEGERDLAASLRQFSEAARANGLLDVLCDDLVVIAPDVNAQPQTPTSVVELELASNMTSTLPTVRGVADASINGLRVLVDFRDAAAATHVTGSQVAAVSYCNAIAAVDPHVSLSLLVAAEHMARATEMVGGRFEIVTDVDPIRRPHVVLRPIQFFGTGQVAAVIDVGAPVVVQILDLISYANPSCFPAAEPWVEARRLLRATVEGAAAIVAISDVVAREIRQLVPLAVERNIDVVHCGTDHVTAAPMSSEPPASACTVHGDACALWSGTEPVLLAFGNSFHHKGRLAAIDVHTRLLQSGLACGLVLAGFDPGAGSSADAELAAIEARPAARDRIHRMAWVDDDSRRALMRRAAVLLYPSIVEGFGLVPFEAAHEGLPTLLRPTGVFTEVAVREDLIWDDTDLDLTCARLARLITDPDARQAALDDMRRIGAEFTWRSAGERLAQLLWRAAARGRPGAVDDLGSLGRGNTVAATAHLAEEVSALQLEVARVSRELAEERDVTDELRGELARVGDERDRAGHELALMTQTISWRLTGPLRSIRRWLPAR